MKSTKLLAILLSLLMLIPLVGAYTASALDPIIEKKGSDSFSGAHNSDKQVITDGDISFLRITPSKDASVQAKQVNFDTVVKFTVSEGMYFKALVRTNVKGTPCVNFKIDGKFTGNTKADESLGGDGNWEEILVKVPGSSGEVTQMWCFLMGYDNVGSFASNAYIDVAGWGIFDCLADAYSHSFYETLPTSAPSVPSGDDKESETGSGTGTGAGNSGTTTPSAPQEPIVVKTGDGAFGTIHNTDKEKQSAGDVTFWHVTPTKDAAAQTKQVNFDLGVKATIEENYWFKALVRTNVKGIPCINPKLDGSFKGGINAASALVGNEKWEEIYVRFTSGGELTQLWAFLMSYDNVGSFAADAYIDAAAWGIFASLDDARNYTFFEGLDMNAPAIVDTPTTNPDTELTEDPSDYEPISVPYGTITKGICNGMHSAKVEMNVSFEGKTAVKVTPTPDINDASAVNLDNYGITSKVKINSGVYKYVVVDYYYDSADPSFTGKMRINMIKPSMQAESLTPVVTGKWAQAVFRFPSTPAIKEAAADVAQFHFYPYNTTNPTQLNAKDVMYISDFTFYATNPDKDATYELEFKSEDPDVTGTPVPVVNAKYGDEIKIPECTFVSKSSSFEGWKCSVDGKVYQPGDTFKTPDTDVTFLVVWKKNASERSEKIAIDLADYNVCISNGGDGATLENTLYEGRKVIKVIPNTKAVKSKGINIDGWQYTGADVDLSYYKWFAVSYKYETNNPLDANMQINIMTNGGILKSVFGNASREKLEANKWAFAVFDMTGVDSALNPDSTTHVLKQMHFYPFGDKINCVDMNADDVMYINQMMFFRDEPKFETIEAYMTGYDDGSFKPNKTMSRAEACTVIARLLAPEAEITGTSSFTDVAADKWYAKYIGFCEAKGLLTSYSGTFAPDKAITRAEFAELVFNTKLAEDTGKAVSFTDVTESHPKYTAIKAAASAGLITGYEDGTFLPDRTITRAQVVTVINRARGRERTRDDIPSDIEVVFTDVDDSYWAFANIAEATVAYVSMDGKWVYALTDPMVKLSEHFTPDYKAGDAKVAEVDALTEKRIAEIRATKSAYAEGGTTYYVANDGNDDADGTSPEKAWKTVAKVSAAPLRNGDKVLFKRGDLWRERLTAKSGVTYSAYGEGDKPRLYGSPEDGADASKWTLYHEDKTTGAKIWKYANEGMTDVGEIIMNGGSVYTFKETPNYVDGKFVVRNNPDKEFDLKVELDRDLEFFHKADSVVNTVPNANKATGPLYLRCDKGNPGEIFDEIEFNTRGNIVGVSAPNVTIDNLCIMYGGSHGIGSGTVTGFTVTNCEIGWIGGAIQSYNFRATNGSVTRFGNGVEIYGGCDGYTVDNCYVYQCYDAGLTPQLGTTLNVYNMYDIKFINNVVEKCVYNIEYWLGASEDGSARDGKNYLIENNIFRLAGYGFGSTRPDGNMSGHIKTWAGSRNEYLNYEIKNNIFDRGLFSLFQIDAWYEAWLPTFDGNTFIQDYDNRFCVYGLKGGKTYKYNVLAENVVKRVLGDKNAKVYFVESLPKYEFDAASFEY